MIPPKQPESLTKIILLKATEAVWTEKVKYRFGKTSEMS